jgi:multidrug resistance efflux pump
MKRWIYVVVPALILAGLIGWRLSQKRAEAAKEQAAGQRMRSAPALVETATVKRGNVVKTFEAVGSVEAPLAVDVSPKVIGRIRYLGVREGDRVRAKQVLVRLDPSELQAEVRQRQAALAQARSRLAEAAFTQSAQGVGVASAVRQQQAALRTAQAQERQARADYEAQIAAAEALVADVQGRIAAAEAGIGAADAAIVSAEANVANARTEVERQETLVREGAGAQQVLDNARTLLQVQEAVLGRARQERRAAVAARASAQAQRRAAERQVQIARNKARADVAASAASVVQARATLESARANTAQTPAYAQNLLALRAASRRRRLRCGPPRCAWRLRPCAPRWTASSRSACWTTARSCRRTRQFCRCRQCSRCGRRCRFPKR